MVWSWDGKGRNMQRDVRRGGITHFSLIRPDDSDGAFPTQVGKNKEESQNAKHEHFITQNTYCHKCAPVFLFKNVATLLPSVRLSCKILFSFVIPSKKAYGEGMRGGHLYFINF